MRAEIKRDVNYNYLILQGEETVDTASYQVRMLAGNVIPSVLKCHIQNLDGKEFFYYNITSKQSVAALFEERRFRGNDIRLLFDGFVRVMEELAEFLMNPEQLILKPEYIYLDVEARRVYFCCLPGWRREIQSQFRELTEYMLPKLDHEDQEAVTLGYGIYRKALGEGFQLEKVKAAIYQKEESRKQDEERNEQMVKAQTDRAEEEGKEADEVWREESPEYPEKDKKGKRESGKKRCRERKAVWKWALCCSLGVLAMLGLLAASFWGIIPWIPVEMVLASGIGALALCTLAAWLTEKHRQKKEETALWREKVKQELDHKSREEPGGQAYLEEGSWEREPDIGQNETKGMTGITGNLFAGAGDEPGELYGETMILSAGQKTGPAALVSREPGELPTIFLEQELTVIGKLINAADAVIPIPAVSRIHARVRKRDGEYYLADLNSRNGTAVNGRLLKGDEEYLLQDEDQIDFAQARYVFVK